MPSSATLLHNEKRPPPPIEARTTPPRLGG